MGTAGVVLVCQSDSQQIVAINEMMMMIKCLCAYVCMCTFSTCSFSMQHCHGPLCTSLPVKHAAVYSSSAFVACVFTCVVYACCRLPLIVAHNTRFCHSNGRLG